MARTPLFRMLRNAAHLARIANCPHSPPADELIEIKQAQAITRRRFLKSSAAAALSISGVGILNACSNIQGMKKSSSDAKIIIAGAGLAGLTAAWELRKAGLHATVYEASHRAGGRVHTARDLMGPGLTTELGGEFIDSNHTVLLEMAREFGLELLDTQSPDESAYKEVFYFGGEMRSEEAIIEAFRPIAARMEVDLSGLADVVDYRNDGGAGRLDRTSISEYLEKAGAHGWIRDLLEVAYVTEYGLECGEQSSLNLLYLISTDVSRGFQVFGESDERFKIRGGNQRITDELSQRLNNQIIMDHQLVSIRKQNSGYILTYESAHGGMRDVSADIVLLTLPFSILREVEISVELPPVKRNAIRELGYGTNSKLFAGFTRRLWRDQGKSGSSLMDLPFQCSWDNSRCQSGEHGGLTIYMGGQAGLDAMKVSPGKQIPGILTDSESVYPGISQVYSRRSGGFDWPGHPYSRGSYSAYRVGQWTAISGIEGESVGNLFFAGEHCSRDFQGFMNGAAETGRNSALTILKKTKAVI